MTITQIGANIDSRLADSFKKESGKLMGNNRMSLTISKLIENEVANTTVERVKKNQKFKFVGFLLSEDHKKMLMTLSVATGLTQTQLLHKLMQDFVKDPKGSGLVREKVVRKPRNIENNVWEDL